MRGLVLTLAMALAMALPMMTSADFSIEVAEPGERARFTLTWPTMMATGEELTHARVARGIVHCRSLERPGEAVRAVTHAPRGPKWRGILDFPPGRWTCKVIVFTEDDLRSDTDIGPLAPVFEIER